MFSLIEFQKLLDNRFYGGYINCYGLRVPNPCQEIDSKGRDLDKINKLMHQDWKMSEEILDKLNSFKVPTCGCVLVSVPVNRIIDGRTRIYCPHPIDGPAFPTQWTVETGCHFCHGTGVTSNACFRWPYWCYQTC